MGGVVSGASSTKEIEPDVSDPPHTSPEVIPIAKTPSFHSMPSNVKVSGKKLNVFKIIFVKKTYMYFT